MTPGKDNDDIDDAEDDDFAVYVHNQKRLDPKGELPPQDWMETDGAKAVMGALMADGGDARFVGGCVRDAVIKRPVSDVDIATPLKPDQVLRRLRAHGVKAIETGIEHGTVTAMADGKPYEITTLREDVKTDGRHAVVAFTEDWARDAARRDFTFNALSCTVNRQLYDPFDGLLDLAEGRVRFIGAARKRIEEDYLRILRFFRFHATHGRPPPDRRAIAVCRQYARKLTTLPAERIWSEISKTLPTDGAADVIGLMRAERILEPILPEAKAIGRLRLIVWLETRALPPDVLSADTIRRFGALLDGDEKTARDVAARLRLSGAETNRLAAMKAPEPLIRSDLESPARDRLLYRLDTERFIDHLLLNWADERVGDSSRCRAQTAGWTELLAWARETEPKVFPLKGRDMLKLGLDPGPKVGELLKRLEKEWLDGGLNDDRRPLLVRAETLVKNF